MVWNGTHQLYKNRVNFCFVYRHTFLNLSTCVPFKIELKFYQLVSEMWFLENMSADEKPMFWSLRKKCLLFKNFQFLFVENRFESYFHKSIKGFSIRITEIVYESFFLT